MKRFRNILVSVDTRSEPHPALHWAVQLAQHHRAALKIVDVLPQFPVHVRLAMPDEEHVRELLLREKREQLESLAATAEGSGIPVTTKVLSGTTSVELVHEVMRDSHDLIMRASKGLHSRRAGFFGTTSFRLLRKCPCPVWIVAPDRAPKLGKVLAAVDPFPHDDAHATLNGEIIELAQSIAKTEQSQYELIHVWSIFGEDLLRSHMRPEEFEALQVNSQREVEKTFDRLLVEHDLAMRHSNVHLVKGEPTSVIPQFTRDHDIDLLIIGTVGRSGISGLIMGNIAEQILNRVECAVLALKPASFVSPIKLPDAALESRTRSEPASGH